MRAWALRIIGLLNILFAIFALLFEGVALLSGGKFPTKVTPTPMDWIIFALLLAVSNYLVVHPALYGIRLIRKDESALLPCALLFAAQTLVFTLGVYIMLYWRSMLEIVTGLWVFAVLPIQFSVAFGYSTIGLVVTITLLTLSRRAARNRAEKDATAIQSTL
jgi:hypothetical protein